MRVPRLVRTAGPRVGAVVCSAVLLAGCAGSSTDPSSPSVPTAGSPSAAPSPTPTPSPQPTSGDVDLTLTDGTALLMPGADAEGIISNRTPVLVSYSDVTCADTFPGMGLDQDTFEPSDLEAPKGKQMCLVSLSVKNLAKVDVSFGAESTVLLRGSDGKEYPVTEQPWSASPDENNPETEYAGDTELIEPGKTGPVYFMFEVADGVTVTTLVFVDYGQ